jgi:L-fucose isomerase-like protein
MEENTSKDLFVEYYQKIEEFLKIHELNIKDAQMSLPSVRHYWVGRLMFHKQQINKLKKAKEKAAKTLRIKLENESPVGLSPKTIAESISKHEIMQKIDDQIVDNELLVEYLTKVESNFRDAQYGMNNLTKIITLETT